jgi:ATP-dependent exoDNAse (exonuclease V) alpha subunit
MKDEKGLRRNQKVEQIRKEFEKHPDNPFNQVTAAYNANKEDMAAIREGEMTKKEKRLAGVN